jgi:hypothetical protein
MFSPFFLPYPAEWKIVSTRSAGMGRFAIMSITSGFCEKSAASKAVEPESHAASSVSSADEGVGA